jgi:hypothetical protein
MAGREDRKAELILALGNARTKLDAAGGTLHQALDFRTRVGRSLTENKWLWLGGAAIVGVVLARLPGRTRKVKVDLGGKHVKAEDVAKTGVAVAVAKLVFDLARPILLKLAMEKLRPWAEKRFGGGQKA